MLNFWNDWGLLNAFKSDGSWYSENCLPFTYRFALLVNDKELLEHIQYFILVDLKTSRPGLFNQLPPDYYDKNALYTSHDQLNIIALTLPIEERRLIWEYLKEHWFTYDNLTGKTNFRRIMRPWDVIFYGIRANSWICKLLFPLMVLCFLPTMFKKGTSGKLQNFDRFHRDYPKAWKFLQFFSRYSLKETFQIYFTEEDHNIRLIVDKWEN